jgi:hypothetical protein
MTVAEVQRRELALTNVERKSGKSLSQFGSGNFSGVVGTSDATGPQPTCRSGRDRELLEARVGFEPTNGGFADLSLGPLGYRAELASIANLWNIAGASNSRLAEILPFLIWLGAFPGPKDRSDSSMSDTCRSRTFCYDALR